MPKTVSEKYVREIEVLLPIMLNSKFELETVDIISVGIEAYEDLLLGVVANKNSMADPENFYDDYIVMLETYKFTDEEDEYPTLHVPDEDNFIFEGTLSILQFIVEGVTGVYLELPEVDLSEVLKAKGIDDKVKRRLRDLPGITSTDVPIKQRFRLLHTRGTLYSTVQAVLNKKLVAFPFSNTSPVDLFTPMQEYVSENIESWINESTKDTLKIVTQRYK